MMESFLTLMPLPFSFPKMIQPQVITYKHQLQVNESQHPPPPLKTVESDPMEEEANQNMLKCSSTIGAILTLPL